MIEMKVGIIGGSDGLGKTLIYFLRDDFDVIISARDHKKGRKIANELGIEYIESNTQLAEMCDVVIVSVPIHFTPDVIREVAPFMRKESLMVDVTSVKEIPSQTMKESLPDDVEYLPTHPIFGPRTTELDNQVIVLTPDKKGKWFNKVYNYLDNKNMRIIETTAKKHDYMMSIVQVLTHFSFISTASAMEKLKVDIGETEDFESPIYNLMIDMIARIVAQNPYLTYYIQSMNNNGPKIRNTFAEAVNELRDVINNGNEDKFVDLAIKATKNMGDISGALGRSDKAINSLNHEHSLLNQSIGKEIGLKHIYSGKIHVGILERVDKNTAILKNGNKTKKLVVANIEVLSDSELYDWKVKNLNKKTESISCVFPIRVDKHIILDTITNLDNIIDAKITDVYQGPQIKKDDVSLTFEVTGLYKDSIENAKSLLTGFGGIIR